MSSLSRRQFSTALGAGSLAALAPLAPAVADPGSGDETELLQRMRVPTGQGTAAGPVWAPTATGFAGVPGEGAAAGTIGGLGGKIVLVRDAAALAEAVHREGPTVVLVHGSLSIAPFGTTLKVSSDTSILGVGPRAEIVGGGFHLDQVANVVIRNLTIRDSFVAGDWDGKFADNDNDGIRVDTSRHVWIDHCEFVRLGDGQVDIRKNSTNVTVSWCIFRDHNKTLGVGWTDDVVTTLTLHHNWFSNTHQRNGSIDNVALGHVYNCWLSRISSYAMASRGASQLLIEHSLFEDARDAIGASDDSSRVAQNGNVQRRCWGKWEDTGIDADPADHYEYALDPVQDVPDLLERHAGPHARRERVPCSIHVAQDGSGDVLSIHAAVGAAARSRHPVQIVVHPGTYRETVTVWPDAEGLVIQGASGDPADVVVTYDKPAMDWATLTVLARDVTLAHMTCANTFAEAGGQDQLAFPLRAADDSLHLEDVELLGGPYEISDPRTA